jgi:hypothetical protein
MIGYNTTSVGEYQAPHQKYPQNARVNYNITELI